MLQLKFSLYSQTSMMINHQNIIAFTLLLTDNLYIHVFILVFNLPNSFLKVIIYCILPLLKSVIRKCHDYLTKHSNCRVLNIL